MLTFLESLLQSGQPVLDPGQHKPEEWINRQLSTKPSKITVHLQKLHNLRVLEFPGEPLEFNVEAAWLGFRTVFILISATAFREIEISQIKNWLRETSDPLPSPAAHFSADLCLHHLPAIRDIVIRIADGDPLLDLIHRLGTFLPLSSVGLPLPEMPDLSLINAHPGLAQFHAERVISLSDQSRAADPSVARFIAGIAGNHRDQLIPPILHSSS